MTERKQRLLEVIDACLTAFEGQHSTNVQQTFAAMMLAAATALAALDD